jgi:c-di-GMP-binding flagellar brake protein YcgR
VLVAGSGIALECRGLDLSVTGMGVELPGVAPWPLGATVEVRISPLDAEELVLSGWLARRFEHLRHLERCSTRGLGIAFDVIAPAAHDAIARYVSSRLDAAEGLPIPADANVL